MGLGLRLSYIFLNHTEGKKKTRLSLSPYSTLLTLWLTAGNGRGYLPRTSKWAGRKTRVHASQSSWAAAERCVFAAPFFRLINTTSHFERHRNLINYHLLRRIRKLFAHSKLLTAGSNNNKYCFSGKLQRHFEAAIKKKQNHPIQSLSKTLG